jgi:hypothetical protein
MNKSAELSAVEQSAIASLRRLAKRWPKSLMLFSWSGSLCVVKLDEDGNSPLHSHDPCDHIICTIEGIGNDGGDP